MGQARWWVRCGGSDLLGLLTDPRGQLGDLGVDLPALREQLADLPLRVHHRGVVAAAELLADLRQRQVGELPAQIHGDLAGGGDVLRARRAAQLVDRQTEVRRRLRHDQARGDLRAVAGRDEVLQHHLGERQVDRLPVERGERRDPDQCPLELADVGLDPLRDELQHLRVDRQPLLLRLLVEDGDAGLQVRRMHVGDQAGLEPRPQPRLERLEQLRRPVGGHHDLLLGVLQRVEGVEELLLGLDLALEELDVVDQQHVDLAVAAPELDGVVLRDRVDELVGELLGGDVAHPRIGVEV
ncbi:hypothetical protein SDC9_63087 [bioreactor metagenome]|uniref:Uncharacterized protein n=1 Tax=bioreactor metagenome TaxID=1076179 RepID=A0A644XKI6_9ZZZZ